MFAASSSSFMRSKESAVVLSSIVSCQNSCSRCFLQIFHAKILTRCRLEATYATHETLRAGSSTCSSNFVPLVWSVLPTMSMCIVRARQKNTYVHSDGPHQKMMIWGYPPYPLFLGTIPSRQQVSEYPRHPPRYMMARTMAIASALTCARPQKLRGIFLNPLGSIMVIFLSIGTLLFGIFIVQDTLKKIVFIHRPF